LGTCLNKGVGERSRHGGFKGWAEAWPGFDADKRVVLSEQELYSLFSVARVHYLAAAGLAAAREVSLNDVLDGAMIDSISGKLVPKTPRHQHQRMTTRNFPPG
jgi:hypothetical protein